MKRKRLTHLNARGEARMVDVSAKPDTERTATAEARVTLSPAALEAAKSGGKKGDVFAVARVAGIAAAKRTSELIPLCHPLPLTKVSVDIAARGKSIRIEANVKTKGPTGVEMEALTAASIAALTIYDMLKSVDRAMAIGPVRLLHKAGGKSGAYRAKA